MTRVLVACEYSGVVRNAFAAFGCDAWSCDILDTEQPGNHIKGDVLNVINDGWDIMIAHPPCTYLARSGARWKSPEREIKTIDAFLFVKALWNAPIPRVAIENPVGRLNKLWRYPDQTVQPFYFGDPFMKTTNLWLRGLPPLIATNMCASYLVNWTERMHKSGKERSKTFEGFARAMAQQWSNYHD